MKLFFALLLCFISQISFAQCDDTHVFSESEKEAFVQVYLKIKKVKPQLSDEILYSLTTKHKITAKQFREIQDQSKTNEQLTVDEKSFVSELQRLKGEYTIELQNVTEKECLESDLDHLNYQAMQHQYRSCMRFQRSLGEYFKKWMK